MPDIVQRVFEEWTLDKGPLEQRVSVFNHIRDIPYLVVPELGDLHEGLHKLIEFGCGSCTPKHFLLGQMFANLDLPIKYVSFPYSWNQWTLDYTEELRELSANLPIEYHLGCKAQIDGKWIYVDATWDLPLKKAGFPVNESWDGVSDTHIAIDPIDEIEHASAEERAAYVKDQKADWTKEDHERSAEFYEKFNAWLAGIRI